MTDRYTLHHGDCIEVMRGMAENSVDAIVTDPPYELTGKSGKGGFMGKEWDATGIAFNKEMWAEALRILKPGGHLLAFSGSRTYHRMAVAIEDAGFEIREQLQWLYGQGFPKSLNVSKSLADATCRCDEIESSRETRTEPDTEHGLRDVQHGDVSTALPTSTREGSVLLAPMSQSSASATGRSQLPAAEDRRGEPSVEGWRDLPAREGQLHRAEVRPLPGGFLANGAQGRVHHGTPPADGDADWSATAQDRSGEPHQPRSEGQPARESGVVSDQRRPQAWGGWPVCRGCGKPTIPSGLGTALKPAHEPIVLARKPLIGTVAANVLAHGTGALNIDGCRVGSEERPLIENAGNADPSGDGFHGKFGSAMVGTTTQGRWPANVIHDGSDEVVGLFPDTGKSGVAVQRNGGGQRYWDGPNLVGAREDVGFNDSGSAARFFYCAKASKRDRNEGLDGFAEKVGKRTQAGGDDTRGRPTPINRNHHPTVKPTDLMRYLIRLITPPGAVVLDPFMGSGSTGKAAMFEGVHFIGIEQDADYLAIAEARIKWALAQPLEEVIFPRPAEMTEGEMAQLAFPIEQAGEASA